MVAVRSIGVLGALLSLSCAAPSVTVLRPTSSPTLPCTAPPPPEPARIFAGMESAPPRTEGNLRLVDYAVDDRLTSPGYRSVLWGDAGRMLTVEQDRAIVWDGATGAAVASVRLPEAVKGIDECAARQDLSRAACVVHVKDPDRSFIRALLGVDMERGEARLFGEMPEVARPFTFAEDGRTLIAGGDLWNAENWTHDRHVFTPSPSLSFGVPLAHPRSGGAPGTMIGATFAKGFPMRGPRWHQRLVPFGPRLVQYREAALDVTATEGAAQFHPAPGYVSVSAFDGAPDVRFPVEDPDTIVVLSPNGRWIGTLAREFTLRKATSPDTFARIDGMAWANRALLSDDGRILVVGYDRPNLMAAEESDGAEAFPRVPEPSPRLEAWDLSTGTLLWKAAEPFPNDTHLSSDGRFLWSAQQPHATEVRTGRKLRLDRRIRSVSPEGVALLDDAWGGTTLVDLVAGRVILAPRRRAQLMAATRTGYFATRSHDHSLQLETPNGCVRLISPGQPFGDAFEQRSVAFSEDSSTLVATVYRNGTSFFAWDASTGAQRYALRTDQGYVRAELPLRVVQVISTARYPTPLSQPDFVTLDVNTGEFVSREPYEPRDVPYVTEEFVPGVRGKSALTAFSSDRRYSLAANDAGEFAVGRTKDGTVLGRAHFEGRHDRVQFAWFPAPGRVAVQTARGGIFEFELDTAR